MTISAPVVSADASRSARTTTQGADKAREPRVLDWVELLPEDERDLAVDMPDPLEHDYLDESGPAAIQSGSSATNVALNGTLARVPGFVVPLTVTPQGLLGEFLLVPYFGACIHMPPPPPNQIIYVKFPKGFDLKSLYEPVWVTGALSTAVQDTRMASTAYTLSADKVELYEY